MCLSAVFKVAVGLIPIPNPSNPRLPRESVHARLLSSIFLAFLAWFTCGKLTQKLSAMRLRYFVREQKCFQKGRGFSTLKEHKRSHTSGSRLESHGYTPEVFGSPHLCVGYCGALVFDYVSRSRSRPLRAPIFVTHNFNTHPLSHTTLSHTHTIFHTPSLSHTTFHTPSFTHNFVTHHFVTHHLSQTTLSHHLSHTISLTQLGHTYLCYTPSFTNNFVTHTTLSQNIFVTHHLAFAAPTSFIDLSLLVKLTRWPIIQKVRRHLTHHCHTVTVAHHCHTIFHTPSLSDTFFHTQLCHTPSFRICRAHKFVTHLLPYTILVTHHLSHTTLSRTMFRGTWWHLESTRYFAWQVWRLVTSTLVSRGRRGAWWHLPSFCLADVALAALDWLWWRAWARFVAGDAAVLCVAGVALGDIHLCLVGVALGASAFVLRGGRGTCGAGLALVARLGAVSRRWRRGILHGRRGTWRHPPSFHMVGVALGDICFGFAWEAWRWRHWAGSGGALGRG